MLVHLRGEDADLLFRARIADAKEHEEAIDLRLGQGMRPFELDRILRRDDEEGAPEAMRGAIDRHLPLLHDLEEARLRSGRGAVDLVGEKDVGKDGPRKELEAPRLGMEDRHARDVAREEIRSELDAFEAGAERLGEAPGEHRLSEAGHILDQKMAASEEGSESHANDIVLADDDATDVVEELFYLGAQGSPPKGSRLACWAVSRCRRSPDRAEPSDRALKPRTDGPGPEPDVPLRSAFTRSPVYGWGDGRTRTGRSARRERERLGSAVPERGSRPGRPEPDP